jgi:hypothetical protein
LPAPLRPVSTRQPPGATAKSSPANTSRAPRRQARSWPSKGAGAVTGMAASASSEIVPPTNTGLSQKRKRPPRGAWCGGRLNCQPGHGWPGGGPRYGTPETGSLNTPSRCLQVMLWSHRDVARVDREWGEIVISSSHPAGDAAAGVNFCRLPENFAFAPGGSGIYSEISRSARAYGPHRVMQRRNAYPRPSLKQGGELEATMVDVVVGGHLPIRLRFSDLLSPNLLASQTPLATGLARRPPRDSALRPSA